MAQKIKKKTALHKDACQGSPNPFKHERKYHKISVNYLTWAHMWSHLTKNLTRGQMTDMLSDNVFLKVEVPY